MVGKLKAGFAKTTDETLKKQAAGFKVYKAQEPFGSNTLYVVQLDPDDPEQRLRPPPFAMLQKSDDSPRSCVTLQPARCGRNTSARLARDSAS